MQMELLGEPPTEDQLKDIPGMDLHYRKVAKMQKMGESNQL